VVVYTNEDWLDTLAYYDVSGSPIDLSGIDFQLEMRASAEDVTALINISNNPYDDPADGKIGIVSNQFAINVPISKMSRIPKGDYVLDAVGRADGMQRVIMNGTISVVQGVTR
jgi:hypothetical protein